MDELDGSGSNLRWDRVARGASTGFSVLIVGGLAQPLIMRFAPLFGTVWLVLVAAVASMVAGWRAADTAWAAVHGALAALLAYVLTIPVVLFSAQELPAGQAMLTAVTTLLLGAVSAAVAARNRP